MNRSLYSTWLARPTSPPLSCCNSCVRASRRPIITCLSLTTPKATSSRRTSHALNAQNKVKIRAHNVRAKQIAICLRLCLLCNLITSRKKCRQNAPRGADGSCYGEIGVYVSGAGEGNRTLVASLGSWCSAIELHPHAPDTSIPQVLCLHKLACPMADKYLTYNRQATPHCQVKRRYPLVSYVNVGAVGT